MDGKSADVRKALDGLSEDERKALARDLMRKPRQGVRATFERGMKVDVEHDLDGDNVVGLPMIVGQVGKDRLVLYADEAAYRRAEERAVAQAEKQRQKREARGV